jgi:hypothetical protein
MDDGVVSYTVCLNRAQQESVSQLVLGFEVPFARIENPVLHIIPGIPGEVFEVDNDDDEDEEINAERIFLDSQPLVDILDDMDFRIQLLEGKL